MPLVVAGVLAEMAHVGTVLLASGALRLPTSPIPTLRSLVGATALDLDHVPQYFG